MASSTRLRRFLDTGDLVLSGLGEAGTAIADDLGAPTRKPAAPSGGGPRPAGLRKERLVLVLLRLDATHREVLTRHLAGEPLEHIAEQLDLGVDDARRHLAGAVAEARRLAPVHATALGR